LFDACVKSGVTNFWQPILLYGAGIIDALLGIATLCGYQLKKVCTLQIIFIFLYSIIISWKLPQLWLEPFAPVAKNIPQN
jgi:hypothetical protein